MIEICDLYSSVLDITKENQNLFFAFKKYYEKKIFSSGILDDLKSLMGSIYWQEERCRLIENLPGL